MHLSHNCINWPGLVWLARTKIPHPHKPILPACKNKNTISKRGNMFQLQELIHSSICLAILDAQSGTLSQYFLVHNMAFIRGFAYVVCSAWFMPSTTLVPLFAFSQKYIHFNCFQLPLNTPICFIASSELNRKWKLKFWQSGNYVVPLCILLARNDRDNVNVLVGGKFGWPTLGQATGL